MTLDALIPRCPRHADPVRGVRRYRGAAPSYMGAAVWVCPECGVFLEPPMWVDPCARCGKRGQTWPSDLCRVCLYVAHVPILRRLWNWLLGRVP